MKEGCSQASINTVIRNKLLEAQMFAIDLINKFMETAPLSFLGVTLLPYRTTSDKSNALNEFMSVKVNIHI